MFSKNTTITASLKNDHMFLIADLFQENYSVLGFVFLFIQWVGDGGGNNKSV